MNKKTVLIGACVLLILFVAIIFGAGLNGNQTQDQAAQQTPTLQDTNTPASPDETTTKTPATSIRSDNPDITPETPSSEDSPPPAEESNPIIIRGTVLDARNNQPIENATVLLNNFGEKHGTTHTDSSGAFLLTVPGDFVSDYSEIQCIAPDFGIDTKDVDDLGDIETDTEFYTVFSLHPGGGLSGTIVAKASNTPIEGAEIGIYPIEMNSFDYAYEPIIELASSEDGTYQSNSIPPGPYRVVVDARKLGFTKGKSTTQVINIQTAQKVEGINFRLAQGGTIYGTVRDTNGVAIQNAFISTDLSDIDFSSVLDGEIMFSDDFGDSYSTDKDGNFEIPGLNFNIKYQIEVDAEEFAQSTIGSISLSTQRPRSNVDFVLQKGFQISGIVIDEEGTPIPDTDVSIEISDTAAMISSFYDWSETDSEGRFVFAHVNPGDYDLSAETFDMEGEEFSLADFNTLSDEGTLGVTVTNADLKNLEIVLPTKEKGTGKLTGTVYNADGSPAANADIIAVHSSASWWSSDIFGKTNDDGTFEIQGLSKEEYTVNARSLIASARRTNVPVNTSIDLQLQDALGIHGRVLDEAGLPVHDARVTLVNEEDTDQNSILEQVGNMLNNGDDWEQTDDQGEFDFNFLDEGAYRLVAKSPSRGSGTSDLIRLETGRSPTDTIIHLAPGAMVSGVVLSTTGQPIKNANVALIASTGNDDIDMYSFMDLEKEGVAMTDIDGKFSIPNVSAGTYQAKAKADNFAEAKVDNIEVSTTTSINNLQITLTVGGCISGYAQMANGPSEGIMVQLMGTSGMYMATTDETGYYELCAIVQGEYMVTAMNVDMVGTTAGTEMIGTPKSIEIIDGESVELDLLPPSDGVPFSGILHGAQGQFAMIMLTEPGSVAFDTLDFTDMQSQLDAMQGMVGQAMIGPDGAFNLGLVSPGTYQLVGYQFNMDIENLDDFSSMMQEIASQEIVVIEDTPIYLELETIP